jgi:hypothetical protein
MYLYYEVNYYWNYDCSEMERGDAKICNTIFADYKSLVRYVEFTYEEYKTKYCNSEFSAKKFVIDLPESNELSDDGVDTHVFNAENEDGCIVEGYIKKMQMQAPDVL